MNLTSPKNQWHGTSTDNDPQGTNAASQPPCHRQGRRQKLSDSDPSDRYDADLPPETDRDAACTMEHRAPNDKGGGVGGRGNGYTSTRSGHHMPGADTQLQICHYVVLAAETPRGRTGILVPESATTCWEQAVRARSSHHHAAPTAKSLSASRRKRRPTPARPTTTRGVHEGSATAFLIAPWVVPVVNSSGSTTVVAGMSLRRRRLGFGHRPCGSRERHGGFVLLSR
jgi:hypothetical protein